MALKDIIKTINPFNTELYRSCKELEVWKDMTDHLISCLKRYRLHVGCVSGEANVLLYYYKIYNIVKELNDYEEFGEDSPLCMVTGPIINVEEDNTSVVIEMFREGLVSLYNSHYRQAEHFRIGGWNYKNGGDKKVYKEEPHSLSEAGIARKPKLLTKSAEIDKYYSKFDGLTRKLEKLDRDASDVNEEFIFLNSEEIKSVRGKIIKENLVHLYKPENEEGLTKDLILELMETIPISPREYPDKTSKPWYTLL